MEEIDNYNENNNKIDEVYDNDNTLFFYWSYQDLEDNCYYEDKITEIMFAEMLVIQHQALINNELNFFQMYNEFTLNENSNYCIKNEE